MAGLLEALGELGALPKVVVVPDPGRSAVGCGCSQSRLA